MFDKLRRLTTFEANLLVTVLMAVACATAFALGLEDRVFLCLVAVAAASIPMMVGQVAYALVVRAVSTSAATASAQLALALMVHEIIDGVGVSVGFFFGLAAFAALLLAIVAAHCEEGERGRPTWLRFIGALWPVGIVLAAPFEIAAFKRRHSREQPSDAASVEV